MEELKKSGIQAFGGWILCNPDEDKMGKSKFAIVEYERVRLITVPIDRNRMLLVSTELQANYVNIVNKILRLKSRL